MVINLFKKYKCVKQHDNVDCGPACLATIFKAYDLKVPISEIRTRAYTNREGTTINGLLRAAKYFNFKAKAVKVKNKELDIYKIFPKPAIAHVIKNGELLHYVVIQEIKDKKIIISDPAEGVVSININEFLEIWSGILLLLIPSENFNNDYKFESSFKKISDLIKLQKKFLPIIFTLSIIVTILGISASFYFKILIDYIIPKNLKTLLISISSILILVTILKTIIEFCRNLIIIHMEKNVDKYILMKYYNHLLNLPINFFETRSVGEIISRFNDGTRIREVISSVTLTLMVDTLMAILGGVILYLQSDKLFFLCFFPITLYLIIVYIFKRKIEEVNRKCMQSNSELSIHIVESVEGIETIKTFNAQNIFYEKMKKKFDRFMKNVSDYKVVHNFQTLIKNMIKAIFEIFILSIGCNMVLNNEITIGTLITFNALLVFYINPIERVINLQPQLQSAFVAIDRLMDIIQLECENINEYKKVLCEKIRRIKFENVSFKYGISKLILNNINLEIKNGDNVAFVGESGSGKTTLAKLLLNFYSIDEGKIEINGIDINDIDKKNIRDKIAYISQEYFLFSESIYNNININKVNNITTDEIDALSKSIGLYDYVKTLPLKYNSKIIEKGINLSGGQKQRIEIIRNLFKNPEVLIMDEATSNLDAITESLVDDNINRYNDIIKIKIVHNLKLAKDCNKIFVMKNGSIIESGTHQELMDNGGYYYRLYNKQNKVENICC